MADTERKHQMKFVELDDGQVRAEFDGQEPFTFSPSSLAEELLAKAAVKGVIVRMQSAASKLTGDDRTPAKLREAMIGAWAQLQNGVWAIERAAAALEVSIEAEAAHLWRVAMGEKKGTPYPGTLEQSAADFQGLSAEQQKKLKANPLYQLKYAEVKQARAAAKLAKLAKKAEAADDFDF